ncbi:hypothetical protein B0H19DRAFT_1191413 [Mycena capillaripes]|nr:hypothetical protein B0H19DRAFT_1199785 [Mycena capillaripes]KAJ6525146.1 hypothetical protein B0H19DRAFT_1199179 [Mycena capillaripes]KAJ6527005.1 hypothetical protein B0H19DRAFT_1196209 [Mycena capillaripes]KAJ6530539.1 hypothetical protein B0H19DRAFT_1191413 [Mycena capillaripes]
MAQWLTPLDNVLQIALPLSKVRRFESYCGHFSYRTTFSFFPFRQTLKVFLLIFSDS